MREPYLIQRLKKPHKKVEGEKANIMQALANSFSFGGGKINGGISKDAMKLLNEIWRYDYMGSSEFEWGAVPESLQAIAKDIKNYIRSEIRVKASQHDYTANAVVYCTETIYYVCNIKDKQEVEKWIAILANDVERKYRTKEGVRLASSMCGEEYSTDIVGWHDIDNHYLFFTDKEMFDNFCKLINLK